MRLLIDFSSLDHRMNGVTRFGIYAAQHVVKYYSKVIIVVRSKYDLPDFEKSEHVKLVVAPIKSKLFIAMFFLPLVALSFKPNVYWSNNHRVPRFLNKSIFVIMTVHDFTWKLLPETMATTTLASEKLNFSRSVRRSNRLICLSKNTGKELGTFFPHEKGKAFWIRPIYRLDFKPCENNPFGNYFLFVGTLEPRKNLMRLVQAFDELPDAFRQKYSLIIAGKVGWDRGERFHKFKLPNSQSIRFIENPDDQSLVSLMFHCKCLVQPSLLEGFGLPILEALSLKKPIMCSNIPAHTELAGGAAVYFDPYSIKSILKAFKFVGSRGNAEKLKEAATKRFELLEREKPDFEAAFKP
jgi:glycosyltransferase involved in cell wall biosynthesis